MENGIEEVRAGVGSSVKSNLVDRHWRGHLVTKLYKSQPQGRVGDS